ncbi:hypothetical protein [Neobacillus vireti]|uniref:Uncharacterized protein n=1 Tax=Neobacillus vireti LMG 21834 TaxID=1131730 RepID=A0AB94IJR0_9BACI|nr:hypothetical protein [Neobacillus vireti]ETI67260.1 hypothetical protein BAVI_18462 [Neobacillus vireti LMG 21834]KLT19655.1 hypothetical protein AA980_03430 [Neobacillus vireti]
MKREEKLISFPYHKRQFIYIVDGYKDLKSKKDGDFLENSADVVFDSLKETFHDTYNPWRIVDNVKRKKWAKLPLPGYVNLVTNVIESIQEKTNRKDFTIDKVWENEEIKPIILDDNTKLRFQVGHPLGNIVYVAHPVEKGTYFPLANFHRLTFEHKWAEATNLLLHLGATEIKVIHKTGWKKYFAANMNVDIPLDGVPFNSGANYQSKENSTSDIIGEFHLPENNIVPGLPDDLVWFHHEETWKEIARGRLKFNLKNFSIQLDYKEDFNVNADFKAKALEYGLGIGGNFEKHESTSWVLQGKFNSIPPNNTYSI